MSTSLCEMKNPQSNTILDLFFQQVDKIPNNIAVVVKGKTLTYIERDIISNQLAQYLFNEKNVILGDFVGIMKSRSERLIV